MAIPSNSPYSSLMIGYFGNLDADDQDALWQAFKIKNGFTSNPLNTDINALVKFSGFIQATFNDGQDLILSPEEVHKRQLLFSLYDLIITMMKSIQNTVGVTGDNIVFLGKYQGVYTDQMAREASSFYIGGASSKAAINPDTGQVYIDDLSKWKLGYSNLTMEEYIKTAIIAKTPATTPLILNSDFIDIGSFPPFISQPVQNSLSFSATDSSITYTFTAQSNTVSDQFPVSLTIPFSASLSIEDKMEIATQGFTTFYNTAVPGTGKTVNQFLNDPLQQIRIPYGVVTDSSVPINLAFVPGASDEDSAKMSAAAASRSTKNSLLQQFLENARSRREIIANQSDTQQSNMDQAKQGLSTSDNILQATIKQLTTILDAVFRVE